jgi:hypothetical protein
MQIKDMQGEMELMKADWLRHGKPRLQHQSSVSRALSSPMPAQLWQVH